MQFEIIGTGAIGLLFAARLKAAGFRVRLWTRTVEKAKRIMESGITYYSPTGEKQIICGIPCSILTDNFSHATMSSESETSLHTQRIAEDKQTYLLLTVKQTHINESLLTKLRSLTSQSHYDAVVALQNGYGHIEKLSQYISLPLLTAVTREASKRLDDSSLAHTGQGVTWIGDELERDRDATHQKNIESAMQKAGFGVFMSKNIREHVFRKLISNAVINPLTALFNVKNGDLPENRQWLTLMEALFNESKMILMIEEPALAKSSFNEIVELCHATASNTSSMRADLLNGVETEVLYINGAISAIAKQHQLSAKLNESIVHMIEALHPVK